MKVLITGDMGFVGSETKRFIESIRPKAISSLGNITVASGKPEDMHEIIGFDIMNQRDIRDINQLEYIIQQYGPDRILHLAAIARFSDADADPRLAFETNVIGTRNVVLMAQKYHIPLVYASTGSVYMPISEKPPITEAFEAKGNSVYGCTKYLGETYVREHTPHIILRYAHLYGQEKRGHGLIGGFLARIERGMAPQLYGGKQSNDFTYIKDVARANYLALTASWDRWNQVYNIGTGEELSAAEAGEIVCHAAGYTGDIEKHTQRTVDASRFVYDVSKAEKMLGFKAQYNFAAGIADMFAEEGTDFDSQFKAFVGGVKK